VAAKPAVHAALPYCTPDIAERLQMVGMQPATDSPEELAAYLKADLAKWTKVVKDNGIKAE
jgi:tripartite-type tricarboxylate transporter receptor subunit TctC